MKQISFLWLLLTIAGSSYAQSDYPKHQSYGDAAISGIGGFSTALSYNHLYGVGKTKRFKIGWGLRLTSFFGKNLNYYTAPAKLTSGQVGPQVLFVENILSNIDTLTVTKTQTNALNADIHLQYSFRHWDIGFNIDALGMTLGAPQTGTFVAASTGSRFHQTQQPAKPTLFNVLLVSDNDIGSLNSELYGRYWLSEKMGIRVGASFQFAEYTTDRPLTFENDRFRHKILMPFIAVSFRF